MSTDRRIRDRCGPYPPINPLTPRGTGVLIVAVAIVMTLAGVASHC